MSRAERVESELVSLADWIERYFASRDLRLPPAIAAGVASARAALALPADAPARDPNTGMTLDEAITALFEARTRLATLQNEIDLAKTRTQPAPEGAGEAVAFNEGVEREKAADELARECFDGPAPSAREADLWIEGWLARARHAHPTPRAEAASAEAVREACIKAADLALHERGCDTGPDSDRFAVFAALRSLPLPAVPAWRDSFPPTHYCRECKALWRRWPDGSWSLVTAACGKCCDNVPMGEQIAPLASEYPTLRVERPTALATPGEVAPGAPNQAGVTAGETAPPHPSAPASAEATVWANLLEALVGLRAKDDAEAVARDAATEAMRLLLDQTTSVLLGRKDVVSNEAIIRRAVAHALRVKGAR